MKLEEVKLRYVRYMIYECGGNKSEAARRLGVAVRTIRYYVNKMKDMGLCDRGYSESIKDAKEIVELLYKFPTNEERIKHLDDPSKREISSH